METDPKEPFPNSGIPDIWRKLQNLALGPNTLMPEIPKLAVSVFYKQSQEKKQRSQGKERWKEKQQF